MNYRNLIKLLGFGSVFLFVVVSAFFVIGAIERGLEGPPKVLEDVRIKSSAEDLKLVRVVVGGGKYVIRAEKMEKLNGGVDEFDRVKVWYYRNGDMVVYMSADRVFVYANNDVRLVGHVVVRSRDAVICTNIAFWDNGADTLTAPGEVSGYSKRSRFLGRNVVYHRVSDKMEAKDVSVWVW